MRRKLLKIGDARLNRPSQPVQQLDTPALHRLVANLLDTMRARRCCGLAAPQIGVGLRVVALAVPAGSGWRALVLVNPRLAPLSAQTCVALETCHSVPGTAGWLSRFARVAYDASDPHGNPLAGRAEGLQARVLQHLCDHLDGILFPQRMAQDWSGEVMLRLDDDDACAAWEHGAAAGAACDEALH